MLLREILEQLHLNPDPSPFQDVAFREKDTLILKKQCLRKYSEYESMIQQKKQLRERVLELKEELCRVRPEALEEIERDCGRREESEGERNNGKAGKGKNGKKVERRKRIHKTLYS